MRIFHAPQLATEVAHFAPLAPLAWLFVQRSLNRTYVLVALAFATSAGVETVQWMIGGSLALTPYFPILQFGLLAAAFGGWGLVVLLPWVAVLQQLGMPGPDMMVTAVGSLGVLYLVGDHPLRASMLWFCGVALVFTLPMVASVGDPETFMVFWWPYQLARLTAFGLFVKAAWKG